MKVMDKLQALYLVIYFGAFAISLGVALYCWQQRGVTGAREYALVAALRALATLGFIGGLVSLTLQAKLVWTAFQWFPLNVEPIATLAFALAWTGRNVK